MSEQPSKHTLRSQGPHPPPPPTTSRKQNNKSITSPPPPHNSSLRTPPVHNLNNLKTPTSQISARTQPNKHTKHNHSLLTTRALYNTASTPNTSNLRNIAKLTSKNELLKRALATSQDIVENAPHIELITELHQHEVSELTSTITLLQSDNATLKHELATIRAATPHPSPNTPSSLESLIASLNASQQQQTKELQQTRLD
mmetsp:Transcript_7091/g.8162  ORF Transcript_7091/g.8162 Transcript_7091/m.8162 type:complete len:200 (+) Transcript_7091:138-737(+)